MAKKQATVTVTVAEYAERYGITQSAARYKLNKLVVEGVARRDVRWHSALNSLQNVKSTFSFQRAHYTIPA